MVEQLAVAGQAALAELGLRVGERALLLVADRERGQGAEEAALLVRSAKQRTGVLPPTPRGSIPTTSKRASTSGE